MSAGSRSWSIAPDRLWWRKSKNIFEQANADLEEANYDYALNEYQACISAGYKLAQSYRGSGIVKLRTGDYQGAIDDLTNALNDEKTGKSDRKDLLEYRAAAELKAELYDQAMADCQTLAEDYSLNANDYYLTGCVALAMDSYDEASSNFTEAYGEDATYDRAIQIYEAYLDKDMEADGTRYLEAALSSEAKDAQDHCDRGRVYYYMEDYSNAKKSFWKQPRRIIRKHCFFWEWYILPRMMWKMPRQCTSSIFSAVGDSAKGYNGLALCDIRSGDYDSALDNITKGLPTAATDEMQSLLFNEIVAYEKKLEFCYCTDQGPGIY